MTLLKKLVDNLLKAGDMYEFTLNSPDAPTHSYALQLGGLTCLIKKLPCRRYVYRTVHFPPLVLDLCPGLLIGVCAGTRPLQSLLSGSDCT